MKFWSLLAVAVTSILWGYSATTVSATTGATKIETNTNTSVNTPYLTNLDLIPVIDCGGNYGTGAWISDDQIITAHHVVTGKKACTVRGKPVQIIYSNRADDFAVVRLASGHQQRLPYSCGGFVAGETYLAIGHTRSKQDFALTHLTATNEVINTKDGKTGQPFPSVRVLRGIVRKGMSGGPIINMQGQIVGTVNAQEENLSKQVVYARDLKDTYLCAPTEILVIGRRPAADKS